MIHPIPTGDLHVSTPTHVLGEITLMLNDFNRRCGEIGHELLKVFTTASEFKYCWWGWAGIENVLHGSILCPEPCIPRLRGL